MEIYVFFTELDKKGLGMRIILSLGEGTPQLTVMIENSIIVILQFEAWMSTVNREEAHTLKVSIVKGGPPLKSINLYGIKGEPTP